MQRAGPQIQPLVAAAQIGLHGLGPIGAQQPQTDAGQIDPVRVRPQPLGEFRVGRVGDVVTDRPAMGGPDLSGEVRRGLAVRERVAVPSPVGQGAEGQKRLQPRHIGAERQLPVAHLQGSQGIAGRTDHVMARYERVPVDSAGAPRRRLGGGVADPPARGDRGGDSGHAGAYEGPTADWHEGAPAVSMIESFLRRAQANKPFVPGAMVLTALTVG
ncbi:MULTISPECIES: hypothetical protein [unclassified Streptomyces]|uniref:hypothetical protein n=1 Tax=unclassified Streptomyces TaxID=2593676 RepID=UPI00336AB0E0